MNNEMTQLDEGNGAVTGSRPKTELIERRSRCCFNLLHVTTVASFMGCLELWYFSYQAFSTIYNFIQTGEQYFLTLSISLLGILFAFIASVLLFVAIRTTTAHLLVPHLLMQVVTIFVLSIASLFCLVALLTGTSLDFRIVNVEDDTVDGIALNMTNSSTYELIYISRTFALILLLICIFLLLFGSLQVWMLTVVYRCFLYLQRKAMLKNDCMTVANGNTTRKRISGTRENCTDGRISDPKGNNCFSLEMNSSKFIENAN